LTPPHTAHRQRGNSKTQYRNCLKELSYNWDSAECNFCWFRRLTKIQ